MKAPAFQAYAADWYMDTNEWTVAELGIYQRLLLSQWVNSDLPSDPSRLARIAGCSQKVFDHAWLTVSQKFTINSSGRLTNLRMEETREAQRKYSEKQRERVNARWDKKDTTVLPANKPKGYSSSSSSNKELKDAVCTDLQPAVDYFFEAVEKAKGFRPQFASKDFALVKRELKKRSLEDLKKQIDFFLSTEKADKYITLAVAMSNDTYNAFMRFQTVKPIRSMLP